MSTSYDKIKYLESIEYAKRKEIFNNENFIRYFLRFIDMKESESNIWKAIVLIPHKHDLDDHYINIIMAESDIVHSFEKLCSEAEHQINNKILIHTIRMLRNLGQYSSIYSMRIFTILKSNPQDKDLKDACMNYCEHMEVEFFHREIHKDIVDYVVAELKNENRLLSKGYLINLLMSGCQDESDLVLVHDIFFKNDGETKKYILDGLFKYCDSNMFINDPKIQRLFLDIYQEVFSWNIDKYTDFLLLYCLFTRTNDIFTVDEIYEKLDTVNDDVFYMFMDGLRYGEFNPNFQETYELIDEEKERIKNIIKIRKHPRGKKLMELFK